MNQEFETKHSKTVPTQFLGDQKVETKFINKDGRKLTRPQIDLAKEFIENHTTNPKYLTTYLNVGVYKHFLAVSVNYFPIDAHNTAYTNVWKTIYIGAKGGIRKFSRRSALGNEQNLKEIWHYYMKAEE